MPALHAQYGPIVRITPDQVLCNTEEAIRLAYSSGTQFTKSDWYQMCAAPDKQARGENHIDMLTETDMTRYRAQKRAIGPAYSLSGLSKHEGKLDRYISTYIDKLKSLHGEKVDLAEWAHIYALDALSWFTLSKSLDFTSKGHDGGNLAASGSVWGVFTVLGMFPGLVKCMHGIPKVGMLLMFPAVLVLGMGIPKMWPIFGFCVPEIMERVRMGGNESMKGAELPANRPGIELDRDTRESLKSEAGLQRGSNEGGGGVGNGDEQEVEEKDQLATIMALQHNKEEAFNPSWALGIALTNFGAGHDTIMHTLSSCIYNLATHPHIITQLRKEMKAANLTPETKYTDLVNNVPLIHAVLKESLRIYPPLSFYVPRDVPETGVTLTQTPPTSTLPSKSSSIYLPPGTTLAISLWATHHNPDLFPSPSSFLPDRWLQDCTPEKKAKIGRMDTFWMGFGGQSRSCPGQYLGRMFVIKVLARLVEEFDFEVEGEPEFAGWFAALISGVKVRFLERGDR